MENQGPAARSVIVCGPFIALIWRSRSSNSTDVPEKLFVLSSMSRFITGDELGNIKTIKYSADAELTTVLKTVHDGSATGKTKAVRRLAIATTSSGSKLVGRVQ